MIAFRLSRPGARALSRVAVLLAALGVATPTYAQPPASASDSSDSANGALPAPAHISYSEGEVVIDRDLDRIAASAGEPVVPGDRVHTDAGRAELWFADGSTLALDERSTLELQAEGLVHLTGGRVHVMVSRNGDDPSVAPYRVDTPLASVAIAEPGEYTIALAADHIALAVVRGSAELLTDDGSMVVRSGERTVAGVDGLPSRPQRFNAARMDDFEGWVDARHDARRGRSTSAQYLPSNLRPYGATFDRDGSWSYEPSYGYVWYPMVDAGWRPYYHGVWRPLPQYGWTWAGTDRWGWATHHYGRWGFNRSRWFWIPERRFAPAWVSWASAADYVGWCPVGFDNRPIVGFSLSVGNTWAAWVVMPRRSFGVRDAYVARYAYDGRRLPRTTPFALHGRAPIAPPAIQRRDQAVARAGGRPGGRTDGRPGATDERSGASDVSSARRLAGRDRPDRAGEPVRGDRGQSSATASSDGWRMPLPPMAIPRGGARLDRGDRSDQSGDRGGRAVDRRAADGAGRDAPGSDRTVGDGRDDRRWRSDGGVILVPYPRADEPGAGGRRGGRRGETPAAVADDRPTPMAPRNGLRVSPGVAGPQLPAPPGFGRSTGGDVPNAAPPPERAQPRGGRGDERGRADGADGAGGADRPPRGRPDGGGAGVPDSRGGGGQRRGAR